MDGVFGGPAAPFRAVTAAHLGSLAEQTEGCSATGSRSALVAWGLEGSSGVRAREVSAPSKGDVTFMSRQAPVLWVGLGV